MTDVQIDRRGIWHDSWESKVSSNLLYKPQQIAKLKCFSPRLVAAFVQFIEAMSLVEFDDIVGAAPTGGAPARYEVLTILLYTKLCLTLDGLWYLKKKCILVSTVRKKLDLKMIKNIFQRFELLV